MKPDPSDIATTDAVYMLIDSATRYAYMREIMLRVDALDAHIISVALMSQRDARILLDVQGACE